MTIVTGNFPKRRAKVAKFGKDGWLEVIFVFLLLRVWATLACLQRPNRAGSLQFSLENWLRIEEKIKRLFYF
ncbi:MAG: hypothetical protein H6577_08505 [Lewinellaceae bacterium]|nr:hypothetical protein [Saprospiraceae bacterium]MCB9338157.1 hypothetical protein [Lewinellaceae bacterium]